MKFKVGDKVIAKKNAPYNITTNGWKGVVVRLIDKSEYIIVGGESGHKFEVLPKYFDLVNDNKIVITTNGNETVAKLYEGKKVVKTATAKCSPSDTFDFTAGAKIALDRLIKEPFVPHLVSVYTGLQKGVIGKPTNYRDIMGRKLCVGDTVDLYQREQGVYMGEKAIVEDTELGALVMGIGMCCNPKTGFIEGKWGVIKKRSYKEISNGETVDTIKYITERED